MNTTQHKVERRFGAQTMIAPLRRALVRIPGDEFSPENWRAWGVERVPDREAAVAEQYAFVELLEAAGVEIEYLEEAGSVQSTGTYDPALITDAGAVILTSGRIERRPETFPMARALLKFEIPIIGWLDDPAFMDAGDTLWLDPETLLVGRSYRSNDAAFVRLERILGDLVPTILQFEMPNWLGPASVLHLMSVVSLVDEDLAVVYPRAMPVRLLEILHKRGYEIIEVPDDEFDTQGANVLALAPRRVILCAGNPTTSAALRAAGAEVIEYAGEHVSLRRISGPTCNTRPLLRG